MPKRVLDFDALWASDKLAACAEWAQAEYAWFYGLADASGSFEMTNLRVIWGRVAAIRKNLTLERLGEIFEEFERRGLLFTWEENGKRYGHWTGSDVPGRLPPPSWRARLERLAPPVPRGGLAAYASRFGGRPVPGSSGDRTPAEDSQGAAGGRKAGLEHAQGQDWDGNQKWKREETQPHVCAVSSANAEAQTGEARAASGLPERMLQTYEAERGVLPPAEGLGEERRRQCAERLAEGLTLEQFRAAVRRAAATPFLSGEGERGWRASFDWLVANDSNLHKVLAGRYDAGSAGACPPGAEAQRGPRRYAAADVHAGTGPQPAAFGARLKAAALERIARRERARAPAGGDARGSPGAPRDGTGENQPGEGARAKEAAS